MNSKIIITADSTCDLSPELIKKYNIKIIPLYVIMDSTPFKDGLNVKPENIYTYFESTSDIAKTSAPSVDDYMTFFNKYVEVGYTIIHLNISLGFSCSHQNAVIASKSFKNVYPIDTKSLSTGIGLLVLKAAELAKEGKSAEEIVSTINALTNKVEASFIIDTLTYLHKGGRCSAVAKLGANLLKLKPSIEVSNGLMTVGKKFRGDLKTCVKDYMNVRLADRDDIDKSRVFLTYTKIDEQIIELAKDILKFYGFEEILETVAGCTVTAHCGPGTLGILYMLK